MRMLVARVGGRIAQQKPAGRNAQSEEEYVLPGSDRRLDDLMDLEV